MDVKHVRNLRVPLKTLPKLTRMAQKTFHSPNWRRPLALHPKSMISILYMPSKADTAKHLRRSCLRHSPVSKEAHSAARKSMPLIARQTPRYRGASDIDGPSLVVSLDGEIVHCTDEAAKLLERDGQSLIGTEVCELIANLRLRPGTPGYNIAYAELNFNGRTWQRFTLQDRHKQSKAVEISVRPLSFDLARAFLVLLRAPIEGSEFSEDLARLIAREEGCDEGIIITDSKGAIVYVNSVYEAMTGFSQTDAVGSMPNILSSRFREPENYPDFWSRLSRGSEANYFCVNQKKDGKWYFAEQSIRPFVDSLGNVTHFIGRQRGLGSEDLAQTQLIQMAYFDGLTGLPNRNLFLDRLHQEVARASRTHIGFTLLILDVDGFKAVNDNHGHVAGDLLLQELSARLKHCVRDSDTVARLGGDEFAIILAALTVQADITEVLDKIRRGVSSECSLEGVLLPISVSIGAAIYPEHGENDACLIKAADRAMYEAKRSKSHGWSFFDRKASAAYVPQSMQSTKAPES